MRHSRAWPALVALAAGAAVLLACMISLPPATQRSGEKQKQSIEQAIRFAAVQCYALEGAYPASFQYLKDHYGIRCDESRYLVHYEAFGTNLVPDILVIDSLAEEPD